MFLHIVRVTFLLAILAITISFAFQPAVTQKAGETGDTTYVTLYILLPAMGAFVLIIADMLWKRKRLQILSGLFFGVLAGLVFAYIITLIINMIMQIFPQVADTVVVQMIKVLMGAAVIFLCVTFVIQTKDDFRFLIPYVEFSKETKGARPLLLDTSVIIDGRIADIAETRILESRTIVPRFVLAELQSIADSSDKLKRNRGRRGLDILKRLQTSEAIDIQILDVSIAQVADAPDVDAKLVALGEHLHGRIVTNDYNLNKVAQLRGVDVININDLANALKPVVLPGETMITRIIKPGEEAGQGIGYLEDGTMVVIEQGRDYLDREVTITVTSVLQTSAGKMIFGRLDPDKTFSAKRQRS